MENSVENQTHAGDFVDPPAAVTKLPFSRVSDSPARPDTDFTAFHQAEDGSCLDFCPDQPFLHLSTGITQNPSRNSPQTKSLIQLDLSAVYHFSQGLLGRL